LNNYETLLVLDPDVPEEDLEKEIDRVKEEVEKVKGNVVELDKWGVRRLAYQIRKKRQGFYVLLKFVADPSSIKDLDSSFKLDETILRYIIVKREETA
jgi:small subunit ribosomal protein S6